MLMQLAAWLVDKESLDRKLQFNQNLCRKLLLPRQIVVSAIELFTSWTLSNLIIEAKPWAGASFFLTFQRIFCFQLGTSLSCRLLRWYLSNNILMMPIKLNFIHAFFFFFFAFLVQFNYLFFLLAAQWNKILSPVFARKKKKKNEEKSN